MDSWSRKEGLSGEGDSVTVVDALTNHFRFLLCFLTYQFFFNRYRCMFSEKIITKFISTALHLHHFRSLFSSSKSFSPALHNFP